MGFQVPAQFIQDLSSQIVPGILEPLVPLRFVADTFQGLGDGLSEEDIFRLTAAVDTELTGIGKVFTVMEEQIVFLIAQAGPGKGNRLGYRTELCLFFRRILTHFYVTALAELIERRRPDFRIPSVDGIVVVISGKGDDFIVTDIDTVMVIQASQPAHADMVAHNRCLLGPIFRRPVVLQ